jgi:hypothetical protein
VQLLSTTALLQIYSDEEIRVDVSKLTLSGSADDPTWGSIKAYLDPKNNLPTLTTYRSSGTDDTTTVIQACLASVSKANINISKPQKELFHWHYQSWTCWLSLGYVSSAHRHFGDIHVAAMSAHRHSTSCTPTMLCCLSSVWPANTLFTLLTLLMLLPSIRRSSK